jgi:peptidoglycan/xylan/chitin deacetylase (PgdA/CDA1 family)
MTGGRQGGSAADRSLDRLLLPLGHVPAIEVNEPADAPTWLRSGDWRVYARPAEPSSRGEEVARFTLDDGHELTACVDPERGTASLPFDPSEAYRNYISEAWAPASASRRLSSRQLDLFYRVKRFLPHKARLSGRRLLIRWQGLPSFPAWPLDTSVSRLLRFYAYCLLRATCAREGQFAWFWPHGKRAALILTHDVESAEGLRGALELADLEEELGFRSSFNLGAWYDVDPGFVGELTGRGFEIGLHSLHHDRSLFESRASFESQLPGIAELREKLGAEGFRSPATHRVFDWLGELPVSYDCTIPNSDPYEPQPGGCSSVWPFFIGPVVELPYTLPQDNTVFTLLGHRSPALWLEQAAAIEVEHGLIQCLAHPDPGYLGDRDKRAYYTEFLRAMAEKEHLWRALPREVAAWWRERDQGAANSTPGRIRIGVSPAEVAFEPPAVMPAATGGVVA